MNGTEYWRHPEAIMFPNYIWNKNKDIINYSKKEALRFKKSSDKGWKRNE